MLKRRIETLEKKTATATARWIQSLSVEELHALAGPISPEEHAFLASLTTEQLRNISNGHVCLGEYYQMRKSWELKNASRDWSRPANHGTTR